MGDKRKVKIVDIANNALDKPVYDPNVTCKVDVQFNQLETESFIACIGNIDACKCPEAPIFSVENINQYSASLVFSNIKPSYKYEVELSKNGDEKEWVEQNSKKLRLQPATKYGVRAVYSNKY